MADTSGTRAEAGPGLSPSQWLALLTSIVFIAVGVAGFFVTGFDDFAAHDTGEYLLGFEVNPLHNIVHLAIGLVGLALFRTVRGALTYGVFVAVAYAGALVYGLFALDREWDVLSLNVADNWLHAGLTVLGVVLAALAAYELPTERRARTARGSYGQARGGPATGHA